MSSDGYEVPADCERDLRASGQDFKRDRDHQAKWAHGRVPLAGVYLNFGTGELMGGSDSQRSKLRPKKAWKNPEREKHNMVKTTRGNWDLPSSRVRANISAGEELESVSKSIIDLLPTPQSGTGTVFDGVCNMPIYDGVSEGSAPTRLALDVFVKDNRGTERLIEKEYEVLDTNGESLHGRKARRNLRKGGSPSGHPAKDAEELNDDGFELV